MVLEGANLLRLHLPEPEVLEDRFLRLLVDAPVAVHGLRHAKLAPIEGCDYLLDALGVHSTSSRIPAARLHSSKVGTSASRQ